MLYSGYARIHEKVSPYFCNLEALLGWFPSGSESFSSALQASPAGVLWRVMKPRTRLISPGFFQNEHLGELPFEARLLFIGLWGIADREGRLENRPKRIKAYVFPYDNVEVPELLLQLENCDFIKTYSISSCDYIQIVKWHKYQTVHKREQVSEIDPMSNQGLPKADLGQPKADLGRTTLAKQVNRNRSRNRSRNRNIEIEVETEVEKKQKSDHFVARTYFCDKYLEKFNIKYGFQAGKDGQLIKQLLSRFGVEQLKKIIDEIMITDDEWISRVGICISTLSHQANKLAQAIVKRENPSLLDQLSPAGRRTAIAGRELLRELEAEGE